MIGNDVTSVLRLHEVQYQYLFRTLLFRLHKVPCTLCETKIKRPVILYVPLRERCNVQLPS
jgi:hypothetical protein